MSYHVSHSSHAAGAMANILAEVIRLKQISPPNRTRSFFVKKALRFLMLALEADEFFSSGNGPGNPYKSFKASCIALEAICGLMKTSKVDSSENSTELLKKFSLFLTRLVEQEGELSEKELETANLLLEFFQEIDRAEAEIDFNFSDFMKGP